MNCPLPEARRTASRNVPWIHARFGLLVGLVLGLSQSGYAAESDAYQWRQVDGRSLALERGNQTVWAFHFAHDQGKPFFHPVAIPGGPALTWNSPPDHPWHHALWFAWKFINGVNYWETDRKTGKSEGQTIWQDPIITTTKSGAATIELHLDYRDPGGRIVLSEERSIVVSAPDATGQYHFDWRATFTAREQDAVFDRTPLPDEPHGKAYGGYAGLSVRLAKELTERQAHSSRGPVEFSPQSRFRGKATAMDYSGQLAGRSVGIAMCDHPENLNHPTPWYVIRSQVMSYYSPAVICYGKYTLSAGQQMTLRYRVLVHPGRWDADRLTREYHQFVKETSK